MLSQVNASQNSRQTIENTHNGLQPLANIITGRFDSTLKVQSNYYLKEEKKKYQEETTQDIYIHLAIL